MNYKLVSKNSLGVILSLFLVVLISQTYILNFFFDTSLGRTILIFFIIIIAYINKFLGLLVFLFIVILISNNSVYEGFTETTSTEHPGTNLIKKAMKNKIQQNLGSPTSSINNSLSTNLSSNSTSPTPSISRPPTTSTSTPSTGGIEGFDIIGTENNIVRGKQSKTIPVNTTLRSSTNPDPFNGLYTDSYSQF